MENKDLYLEIKNSIGAADTKLGIRIATLWVIFSIIITTFIYTHQKWWVYVSALIIPFIELIIATVGIIGIFGKAVNIKPVKLNPNDEDYLKNKYYFKYIASFKNVDKYIKAHPEEKDHKLLEQIYINAKILVRKHRLFELSLFLIWILKKPLQLINKKRRKNKFTNTKET